jgi:hypothetical protein
MFHDLGKYTTEGNTCQANLAAESQSPVKMCQVVGVQLRLCQPGGIQQLLEIEELPQPTVSPGL